VSVIRVTNWDNFETAESRRVNRLSWVAVPNRHDGSSYCELLDNPNGVAHFGAWVLIVQVASKCPTRGTLVRPDGRPHDAASLARQTHGHPKVLREAIKRLLAIGWLEEVSGDVA